MIKPIIIILVLVAILAALGYGLYYFNFLNKDSVENQEENEPIDISEDSDVVNIKKGDKFLVVLDSNPTTGYSWEYSINSEYIQFIDKDFVSESEGQMVGVGGNETFNFLALESGETEITFSYLRSWEKDVEPIEKKVYNIIIE